MSVLVLPLLFLLRLLLAALLQTSFVPDEYWQGPEVAHYLVFGRGALTWEWRAQIRSAVHPLLIGGVYALLRLCGCDTPWMVAWAPFYLQGRMRNC